MKKVVQTNNPKSIMVQVVLGNPRIGCDGYGICKFITKTDPFIQPNKGRKGLTDVRLFIEHKQLLLIFNKKTMTDEIYQTHFRNSFFRVVTEVVLPKMITDFFEISPSVLACGVFKIEEKESAISVYLALQTMSRSLKY